MRGWLRGRRLRREVEAVPFWWHSIDLGDGVVTPGRKGRDYIQKELASLRLPDLRGKTVLDIGAWDGFYSFEAERRGADRIVALDHFVWERDPAGIGAKRQTPGAPAPPPARDRVNGLPGKAGFDLVHRALGSSVESVVEDFLTCDLEKLGRFDVVLFLGVLYHLEDPLRAMRRLRQVTREVAVIESEAVEWPGHPDRSLFEFFPTDERGGDPTNWWAPNMRGLCDLCRAGGFSGVEQITQPPAASDVAAAPLRYRAIVHARP